MTARNIVEHFLDLVDAGEWSRLPELYAEDAAVEQPFAKPVALQLQGIDAIRAHFARAAHAPLHFRVVNRIVHQTVDPEVVIAEFDYDGVVTNTGRHFSVANVQVFRVRNGRIAATTDYHDHAAIARVVTGP